MMYLPPVFAVVLEAALFGVVPSGLDARRHRGDVRGRGDDRLARHAGRDELREAGAWKSSISSS